MANRKLQIQATELFEKIRNAKKRNVVLEGGARSSKTYSVLQYLITYAFEHTNKEIDIIRETLPALRASAMKDFFEILNTLGLYDERNHNKSDHIYRLHGCNFNFYSADDTQKLRGRKRDIAFLNEANELSIDTYRQVAMRTTEQIILDYNPSEEEHWIYEQVIPRDDCAFIQSTYKNNPFLEKSIIEEIERLENDDPEYWKIFGLGQRGKRTGLIYNRVKLIDVFPANCSEILYGLDFGYSPDPTVLLKVGRIGMDLYLEQLIYDRKLTNSDLINRMDEIGVDRMIDMYADTAEPDRIEEIGRAGYYIHDENVIKDVEFGIDICKRYTISIVKSSGETEKDFRHFKWKTDRNGKTISPPTPVHAFSHAPDAMRYPVASHWGAEYRHLREEDVKGIVLEPSVTSQITSRW